MYAVTRDIRERVLFDPTAEFAGGFSGGGECSYMLSAASRAACDGGV
jgi:hypothetical protein